MAWRGEATDGVRQRRRDKQRAAPSDETQPNNVAVWISIVHCHRGKTGNPRSRNQQGDALGEADALTVCQSDQRAEPKFENDWVAVEGDSKDCCHATNPIRTTATSRAQRAMTAFARDSHKKPANNK